MKTTTCCTSWMVPVAPCAVGANMANNNAAHPAVLDNLRYVSGFTLLLVRLFCQQQRSCQLIFALGEQFLTRNFLGAPYCSARSAGLRPGAFTSNGIAPDRRPALRPLIV